MTSSPQKILMCAPRHFGITYVINPWMEGHLSSTDATLAQTQWENLHNLIAQRVSVELQPPQENLPDLVFTANAGLVLGNKAIVSRFRNPERRGEQPHDLAWFSDYGFDIIDWPDEVFFEGAGDALFDRGQELLWVGHGFRSDPRAPTLLEAILERKTAILSMVNPYFYHLDTCLCPLSGGYLLYYPDAFDRASCDLIEQLVPHDKLLPVEEADAKKFCCNAVDLDGTIIMNGASEHLQNRLQQKGFTPLIAPLSEFMKAGGAAKCLTLKLIEK